MKQSIGLIALFIFVAGVSFVLSAQVKKQAENNRAGAVGEAGARIIGIK